MRWPKYWSFSFSFDYSNPEIVVFAKKNTGEYAHGLRISKDFCKKNKSHDAITIKNENCVFTHQKLSSGHRTGKGQFSFQSQRKAMPKNAQTTTQLHSSHTLVK